ncbi:MAG TPA: Fe2+-dependent dioxygenase [Gammaproteobacteria bacterium]|nr:Fe2+-dependent dioxygenase [Gammaproteobacteria bacterium]
MLITLEKVFAADEVAALREALERLPWHDGVATAGSLGRSIKHNRQADEEAAARAGLVDEILRRLRATPRFIAAALPNRFYPPRFNRYGVGETYGAHVDGAVMRLPGSDGLVRTDLSATLFLSAPDEYDGGVLEVDTRFGVQEVKLEAGDLVLYPASSLHRVTPVTRGERIASFFWIQSMVRDTDARATLFDLDEAIQALTRERPPADPILLALSGVYHNLLRLHAAT